jgi:hypothetical protein
MGVGGGNSTADQEPEGCDSLPGHSAASSCEGDGGSGDGHWGSSVRHGSGGAQDGDDAPDWTTWPVALSTAVTLTRVWPEGFYRRPVGFIRGAQVVPS